MNSEFYDYILLKLYENIQESNDILLNMTYLYVIEQFMLALNDLQKRGKDISFIWEKYDIIIMNLSIAIADEIESYVKIGNDIVRIDNNNSL